MPSKYKIQFEYNAKLIEVIKRVPSRPRYDGADKAWLIAKDSPLYPPGKPAEWYVHVFAQWAVQNRYCEKIVEREIKEDITFELPELTPLAGEHYMLLKPYNFQLEGVAYALNHKRCIFGDQPGLGKLQPYSEPVATPSGFKEMGSLKVGDPIFGRDGRVYHVQDIYEHGEKDIYKVTFNDGTWTRAGGEHLWSVRDVNMRKRRQGWKTMTTEELLEAGLTWGMSPSRKASGRKHILRWEIPMCEAVQYPEKDYIIAPYVMGVLIGDGCLTGSSVEFACPDEKKDVAEKVARLVPKGYTLELHDCGCPHYRIRKPRQERMNKVRHEIVRYGLDVTSFFKHIPSEYLHGSVEQRKELLRGLMDTDGSCAAGKTALSFSSTSPRLSDDVRTLVLSLGGQATIHKYDRTGEGKPSEYRVSVRLPFNPFHTARKAERYKVKRGNYNSRYIKSIEPDGRENSRCILVTAPDHLYLTRDYIVTHNTLQAICAVVKAHKERAVWGESFPCLVICPASLKVNWKREFKKFSGMDAIILDDRNRDTWHNYIMMKRQDGENCCDVFITNYESLKKFFVKKVLPAAKLTLRSIIFDERINLFKTVIIDESHKCKTSKTQQSKYVEGICKGKRFVFALTGTPVVNDNTDLVQQLKILNKLEDFGGYTHFMKRFCDGPKRSSNTRELNWRLWNSCFFRREKQKVLTELPEKTRQYIICDISTRQEYETCEMDLIKYLRQYKNASDEEVQRAMRGEVMVRMGKLKAIAARGKIKAVADFVHDIIDGGEKLILFAYLKDVVLEMKKHFPDAVTVTGSDTIEQKQIAVDRFQTDPDTRLIILNYKSGGTGLTLTASSRVAFIEFPWTYADCEQAEDRAHRNGQKNNVNCYYFLGEKTIDKDMYDLIQTKRSIADGVTGTTTQIDEDMVNITMNLFKDKL